MTTNTPEYARKYYLEHKEERTGYNKRYYIENKDKIKATTARRRADPEVYAKDKIVKQAWARKNREKLRAIGIKWRKDNPDKVRASHARYNAKRRGAKA